MSNGNEDEDIQCFLDVELETLRSIYVNELEVSCDEGRPTSVAIQLYPSTADNVDEQYVRMSLIVNLPAEYPDVIPGIQIKNPRGLSDEKLQRIMDDLFSKAEERKGGTMLFELIERAKDHLTAGNRPSCQCAICLYGFTEQDVFTKTKCYHYFHSHCLSRYVTHQLKESETEKPAEHSEKQEASRQVFCPVCRIPISFVFPDDCNFPPPTSAKEDSFSVTEELKLLQNKMADLYEKQRDKGGIIDVEAEKKKFLLEISLAPSETEPVSETEHLSVIQKSTSEEAHQDISQRKKENDLAFSKNSKTSNSIRNSTSRNSDNRYQKYNQKSKYSNYTYGRISQTRNNKGCRERKSDTCPDEDSSKHYLAEEQRITKAKSSSLVRKTVDLEKNKMQNSGETKEIPQAAFDTLVVDNISVADAVNPDTTEKCSKENIIECIQNKQLSTAADCRSVYHKRYQNYNRRNDFRKQKQYVDDSVRKHTFSEFHVPPFGSHGGFSNRRNENYHQHPRQSDNYRQQRNAVNYKQRYGNAENYHQQLGHKANYHENRHQEDLNCSPRQNDNYRQSRQDFHRKSRYHSRYEQCKPNEREQQAPHYDSERIDYGNSEDHHNRETSPVENSLSYLELKSVEKHQQNSKDDYNKVSKGKFLQKCSGGYENVDRRNYVSSTDASMSQHECHRYQKKYEARPRNKTNLHMKHQSYPPVLPENGVSENLCCSVSNKASASDIDPKHPFGIPKGKMHIEACGSSSSQSRGGNSVVKVHQICDVSPPVFDILSDCNNEIFSPVVNSFSANVPKGSSNLVLKNMDVNHSISRPPPGFAKKVVYGLPSVKPPPGFSQS